MLLPWLIYLAVAVFVLGNLYRIIRIARMPVHLRWEIYPVPHESPYKVKYGGSYMEESNWWKKAIPTNWVGELDVMMPEIFLLAGVWENNRVLWFWSWLMHWGLYHLIGVIGLTSIGVLAELGGIRVADPSSTVLGLNLFSFIVILGWYSGVGGSIGSLGVLLVRLFSPKHRPFNSFAVIFNLVLLIALFATGVVVYSQGLQTFHILFGFSKGVISFSSAPQLTGFLAVHVAIFGFFLIYFPFTHMTHMFVKYFTYHSVRWDDQPLEPGGRRERKVAEALKHPVSWSAPHIRGDGKKNWIDVVSEEGKKDA